MSPLRNATILRRSPLIVTADAITATSVHSEYHPQNTRCLYERKEYVIVRGSACGSGLPPIPVGARMLMELEPA